MDHTANRRLILAAGLLLPASLMTADTAGASTIRADIDDGVAGISARWETLPPAAVIDTCQDWLYKCRTVGGERPTRDWRATTAHVALLEARAQLDTGERGLAFTLAEKARNLGRSVNDTATRAHAEMVIAEIWDADNPASQVPVGLLRSARRRAGMSWLAVGASALAANALARRGPGAAREVIAEVVDAETVAMHLPDPRPGEFTRGGLAAFTGNALVRVGQLDQARERFDIADEMVPFGDVGLRSAAKVYRSGWALASGDRAEAAEHAGRALDISVLRRAPWLAEAVLAQARRTGGGDGWDALAARAGAWQMA